jgi:hypothetical protein
MNPAIAISVVLESIYIMKSIFTGAYESQQPMLHHTERGIQKSISVDLALEHQLSQSMRMVKWVL